MLKKSMRRRQQIVRAARTKESIPSRMVIRPAVWKQCLDTMPPKGPVHRPRQMLGTMHRSARVNKHQLPQGAMVVRVLVRYAQINVRKIHIVQKLGVKP